MSAQQYQYAKSYYQDPYQYQQYMNGTTGQGQGLSQLQQPQVQSQQPLAAQLSLLTNQYQQPMSLYYMMGNQQVPGQLHLQGQQPQQQQYQPYQQPQSLQQLHQQGAASNAADYSHYASYSGASAPYNQYAMYQQSQQPTAQSQMYGVPSATSSGLSGQQVPSTASSATTNPTTTQSGQPGSMSTASGVAAVPPHTAKAASPAESAPSNANVGQLQPPGIRPRVTTTMWEDEKTLCYQVDANNVSVVRRADNNMINGTKLLNVAQMTRGRRDGILKSEKVRHVVKIGSMHLKGVWIPFERALAMAQREGIVDLLYPLFVRDIKRVIQTGVTPAAQPAASATPTAANPASTTAKSTPLVPQLNPTFSAGSTGGAATTNGGAAPSNPGVGYYPQYQTGYPLAAMNSSATGVLGDSATNGSQQQSQQVGQQQMYPYNQPYYNQYYPYSQGGGAAGASSSYASYSAPMYSSSYPYGQQPQGLPYQQPQQPQLAQGQQAQPQPQLSSPLADKKPDLKDKK